MLRKLFNELNKPAYNLLNGHMFKTYNVKTAQQGTETLPFVGPKLWLYLKKVYGIRG